MSQTTPVRMLCRGLQQLQLPFIWKHVLILHKQAIYSQFREQIDELGRGRETHISGQHKNKQTKKTISKRGQRCVAADHRESSYLVEVFHSWGCAFQIQVNQFLSFRPGWTRHSVWYRLQAQIKLHVNSNGVCVCVFMYVNVR